MQNDTNGAEVFCSPPLRPDTPRAECVASRVRAVSCTMTAEPTSFSKDSFTKSLLDFNHGAEYDESFVESMN